MECYSANPVIGQFGDSGRDVSVSCRWFEIDPERESRAS
jgi:hypothetical protein